MHARVSITSLVVVLFACTGPGRGDDELGESGSSSEAETSGEATSSEAGSDEAETTSDTTSDTSDTTTGDGDGDGEGCTPLPAPAGTVVNVGPADAAALPDMVYAAAPGTTFVFAPGTYDMSGSLLHVVVPNLSFRSADDDRESVVLDGGHAIGEIFLVAASNTTIAHMTLSRAYYHAIHITGGSDANTEGSLVHDVAVIDPREQGIKVNASPEGYYSDFGTITCSHIELTDAGRPIVDNNCYTGGIDAHAARGWLVADNHIEGFWCEQGLSEHAVHFWVTGRDTQVLRNTIVDCARGVGFGLGEQGNGNTRDYGDDPCPAAAGGYLGHIDGVIASNTIFAGRPELFASEFGFDSGIALEQACGANAAHNTIVALEQPFVSIEYRWPNTSATLANNLTTHGIVMRDGAGATLLGNLADQGLEHFVDAPAGDLHLALGSSAIDGGEAIGAGPWDTDFEGHARDAAPDVGADERVR